MDTSFVGFEPLDANYIYCPNQFFDVLMANSSRGCFRLVAYFLRRTLGHLDANGEPVNQDITISWNELIENAGVSRGALKQKLDEAIQSSAIEQLQFGRSKGQGDGGQSAQYRLRWGDSDSYTTNLHKFDGFFRGSGHRTPVPNAFFDQVVPNESLAVTKVVGSVLRHTIGYENQFGGRRMTVALSHQRIADYANLSVGRAVTEGILRAVEAGYIELVSMGSYSSDHQHQRANCYGIRWLGRAENNNIGSITPSDNDRFRNSIGNGSEKPPANRFNNSTTRKTSQKDTFKQQDAAVEKAIAMLTAVGCQPRTAAKLVRERGVDVVEKQIGWIDARNPRDNRVGMLVKAIDEDWPKPPSIYQKEQRSRMRERDRKDEARKRAEDEEIVAQKRARAGRKHRVLAIWGSASTIQREKWIEKTVKGEPSRTIAEIIRKQSARTSSPHVYVLDTIAQERELPPVTGISQSVSGDRSSPDE